MGKRITASQNRMTIQEAFNEFIYEKKTLNKAPKTIKGYEANYKRWIRFLDGQENSPLVADITSYSVISYASHCMTRDMNPISINSYLRHIRAFAYWCMEKEYVKPFKIKLLTEQEPVKRTFTDKEKRILVKHPAENNSFVDWRMWAIVNWVLATGNRAGTLCSVLLEDLNFQDSEIVIRKTKSKKAMILPMSPALKRVLIEYVRKWRSDTQETDLLFPTVSNKELSTNALCLSFAKYCRDRDISNTSIHALRHTFAKDYIRNMGDAFRLQKILGHSTLEMTRRYVNMFGEDLKEEYERFSPLDTLIQPSNRKQTIYRTDKKASAEFINGRQHR